MFAIKLFITSSYLWIILLICDALCDLAPLVQFKKREKHSWGSSTSSKVGCFSRFLNCTNGIKSHNAPHIN